MTGINYFAIHILALTLPGSILLRLSGLNINNDTGKPVFILAASYMYFVLLTAISKWLNLPLNSFIFIYLILLALLALASIRYHPATTPQENKLHWRMGLLTVICSFSIYHYLIGPYTEVPADLYRHLLYTRTQLTEITAGHLGTSHSISTLLKQGGWIWYSFYALINSITGLEIDQTLAWAVLANSLIYLSAVYGFSWYILGHFSISKNGRLIGALLATFFTSSHLGLNVFSYLRYYAMAPTMLNMVIYFSAVIALLELLRKHRRQPFTRVSLFATIYIAIALISSILVHTQEGLFILVIAGAMLAWFALYPQQQILSPIISFQYPAARVYRIALAVFILGFCSLLILTYTYYERSGEFFNKVIQLSEQGPILNRLLFLNPFYQGLQVITYWGVLVYLLFIFYWRKFVGHPYVFAGMLTPLLTVFNPLFVDWFLRMDNVHTLWRMLYVAPLHIVAGLLVVFMLDKARLARKWGGKLVAYSVIALLLILLLPLSGFNSNSRLTLAKTEANESYTYWQDLISFLNEDEINKASILTDPITAYMLDGLTQHRTFHYKFFRSQHNPFNFDDYHDAPLARYKNWLLIINDRSGGDSETGAISRHWSENVLSTAGFYKDALREHLRSNPDKRFEKIWERDRISIYKIR